MKYTTVEAVSRKLIGRLQLGASSSENTPTFSANPSSQSVNSQLIEDVINQKEYMLDLVLQQMYRLPLGNKHPILAEIVENLVLQELLLISYVGQGASLSADTVAYGAGLEKGAYTLLQMLTAGKNVYIPNMPPVSNSPGFITPQAIVLPGEILVERNPQILSKVYTVINENKKLRSDTDYREWTSNKRVWRDE